MKEFVEIEYERAGRQTGIGGNHSENREIVRRSASFENFLLFLEE